MVSLKDDPLKRIVESSLKRILHSVTVEEIFRFVTTCT